jgi:predicted MPP superfamily phosphohydrolase
MGPSIRHLPDFIILALIFLAHCQFWRWSAGRPKAWLLRSATVASAAGITLGVVLSLPANAHLLPRREWSAGVLGWAVAWGVSVFGAAVAAALTRNLVRVDPSRRKLLIAARGALMAAPFASVAFGVFIERLRFRTREVEIVLPDLVASLDGLRLVQLSDIHLSPFLREKDLARAVDMANETRAHLAVITGDLITARGDPLEACLRQLARLRSDAGTYGCLGNHEIYAGCTDRAARAGERMGLRFLREQSAALKFGGGLVNLAGVDYQRGRSTYLQGAERLLAAGALNILLSHNPDVFPVAARMGFDLTLSGHTHGGQVTVEFLHPDLTLARFFTPYVFGLYRLAARAIYVTRGLGTVGLPARLGAQPEVALIRLARGARKGAGRA